jgi:hypothetical protein
MCTASRARVGPRAIPDVGLTSRPQQSGHPDHNHHVIFAAFGRMRRFDPAGSSCRGRTIVALVGTGADEEEASSERSISRVLVGPQFGFRIPSPRQDTGTMLWALAAWDPAGKTLLENFRWANLRDPNLPHDRDLGVRASSRKLYTSHLEDSRMTTNGAEPRLE